MILLWITPYEYAELQQAIAKLPGVTRRGDLRTSLERQAADPLLNGRAPRSIQLRDEGDGLPQLMVVFDDFRRADQAWAAIGGAVAIIGDGGQLPTPAVLDDSDPFADVR